MNNGNDSEFKVAEPSGLISDEIPSHMGTVGFANSNQTSRVSRSVKSRSQSRKAMRYRPNEASLAKLKLEELVATQKLESRLSQLENHRKKIVLVAQGLQRTINNTLSLRPLANEKDSESAKPRRQHHLKNGLSSQKQKEVNHIQQNKTLPVKIAELGPKFFQEAMVEGLIEKSKGAKRTSAPMERLTSIEDKYKHVQRAINQIVADSLDRKESAALDKDRLERFKNVRAQVSDLRRRRPLSVEKAVKEWRTEEIKRNSSFKVIPVDGNTESPTSAKQRSDIFSDKKLENFSYLVGRAMSEEKDQEKLRQRIDKLYMKFAKTDKYSRLYSLSKDKLKRENKNFLIETSKPHYLPDIDDYFITGEDLRYITPSILTTPLINTYLNTNSKRFVPKKELSMSEDQNLVKL
jgi:hypothetical protein